MSRRNSTSRRRSYGRRLHELNQRRQLRDSWPIWLEESDSEIAGDGGAQAGEHAALRDWMSPRDSRGSSRP